MKKMFRVLAVSVLGLFLLAGQAMSLTLPPGYSWNNSPFWTNTDLTTGINGNSQFELKFEGFGNSLAKDADFGLFYVSNINAPSSPTLFEVFDRTDEVDAEKTVSFKNFGGSYYVTLGIPTEPSAVWTPFKENFGFYFVFDNTNNVTAPDKYFSASVLDINNNHNPNVFTATNGNNQVYIYLDRATVAGENGSNIESEMTIRGNDVSPIPEPGTLLLLGSGLLGLVFYGRKRMKA